MDVLDEFDINIIKNWKRYAWLLGNCCDIKNIKYDGAPAHQSFNGELLGIKPIINEKKIGYD
jgi:hypothetical protein